MATVVDLEVKGRKDSRSEKPPGLIREEATEVREEEVLKRREEDEEREKRKRRSDEEKKNRKRMEGFFRPVCLCFLGEALLFWRQRSGARTGKENETSVGVILLEAFCIN